METVQVLLPVQVIGTVFSSLMKDGNFLISFSMISSAFSFLAHLWRMETMAKEIENKDNRRFLAHLWRMETQHKQD